MFSTRPGDIVADTDVTFNDVLSGKGKGVAAKPGNQKYSELIKNRKDEYLGRKTVKLKKEVAKSVLNILKAQYPPARFMKGAYAEDKSQVWIIQDDKFANKKITQALREKRDRKKERVEGAKNGINVVEEPESRTNRASVKRSLVKLTKVLTITSCGSRNNKEDHFPQDRSREGEDYFPQDGGLAREESGPIRKSQKTASARSFLNWMKTGSSLKLLKSSVGSLSFGSLFGSSRGVNSPPNEGVRVNERSPSGNFYGNNQNMTGVSTASIATTDHNNPENTPKLFINFVHSKSRMSLIKDSVGSIDIGGPEGQCLKDTEKLELVKESMEFLSSQRMDDEIDGPICQSMRSLKTTETETMSLETTEMKRSKFKRLTERKSMQELEPPMSAHDNVVKPALNLVDPQSLTTSCESSQFREETTVGYEELTGDIFEKSSQNFVSTETLPIMNSSRNFVSTETLPTVNLSSQTQERYIVSNEELIVGNFEKSSSNLAKVEETLPTLGERSEMFVTSELYDIGDTFEKPLPIVDKTEEILSSKVESSEMLANPESTYDILQDSMKNMSLESSDILFDTPDALAPISVQREDSDARMMDEVLQLVSGE
jgi:hypothetical protein